MPDSGTVFNQVNLVVRDMDAMLEFYGKLGVAIEPSVAPWDRHHRTLAAAPGTDFDLDSTAFATQWNVGWPEGQAGPVLGFSVESREEVDVIYERMVSAGYAGQQPPWDTFWGARYAILTDPDGNAVGVMSPSDPARATVPPDPPA